ncbi:hypothetical protein [Thermococcus sp.]|uniref:hypothetical protein n=1 Tax=Thermococcus sp. TaxID=35749 RepID=UPI00261655D4|nr:hypothetical protein [Thermococcus sp.]
MEKKEVMGGLAKILLSAGFLSVLFWYGGEHNITIQQSTETLAKVSLLFVAFIELLDRYADMGKLYGKFAKGRNEILGALLFGGVGFALALWALTGTLTLSGASTPAALFVAGLTSLYIFAPDTGKDPWYFIAWLGATLATHFQYLAILPQGYNPIAHVISWLVVLL